MYLRYTLKQQVNHNRTSAVVMSLERESVTDLMLLLVLGELVQTTDGKWITHPPTRCPNGHALGPNQVLVGHVACLGHGGGGHTSWHC